MGEFWKPIYGYEGLYEVSNFGRVKSVKFKKSRLKTLYKNEKGYLYTYLYKNGVREKLRIHRLVALAFIPNPENKPTVNHIDEDKSNNKVSNLEWATYKEQMQAGTVKQRISETQKGHHRTPFKPVAAYKNDVLFAVYESLISTQKDGFKYSAVSRCCIGERQTHHGLRWSFINEEDYNKYLNGEQFK